MEDGVDAELEDDDDSEGAGEDAASLALEDGNVDECSKAISISEDEMAIPASTEAIAGFTPSEAERCLMEADAAIASLDAEEAAYSQAFLMAQDSSVAADHMTAVYESSNKSSSAPHACESVKVGVNQGQPCEGAENGEEHVDPAPALAAVSVVEPSTCASASSSVDPHQRGIDIYVDAQKEIAKLEAELVHLRRRQASKTLGLRMKDAFLLLMFLLDSSRHIFLSMLWGSTPGRLSSH